MTLVGYPNLPMSWLILPSHKTLPRHTLVCYHPDKKSADMKVDTHQALSPGGGNATTKLRFLLAVALLDFDPEPLDMI